MNGQIREVCVGCWCAGSCGAVSRGRPLPRVLGCVVVWCVVLYSNMVVRLCGAFLGGNKRHRATTATPHPLVHLPLSTLSSSVVGNSKLGRNYETSATSVHARPQQPSKRPQARRKAGRHTRG
jgi:hypothetical protein